MFTIKQNDTLPNLDTILLDYNGTPINLELCSVRFHMVDRNLQVKINREVEIIDINGEIRVNWIEGDTSGSGIFYGEFEVNMPNGKIITIPNDGYITINIIKELA